METPDFERAAALHRQREARRRPPPSAQPPPGRGHHPYQQRPYPQQSGPGGPAGPGGPGSAVRGDLGPPPGGAARKIPPRADPANRYGNLGKERATGKPAAAEEDGLEGVFRLMVGVITVVALASVFVLPRQLKVFWLLVVSLTVLIHLGFMLYREWMHIGSKGGEDAKYAEWASVLLYSLVMLYTAVMTGILFFMAWSLYSIAITKSNIATAAEAAAIDLETKATPDRVYLQQ
jgi:hypothetical protein